MERMSKINDKTGKWSIPRTQAAADRMAAYENTGLEPETITRILEAINRQHPDLRWMIEALGRQ